MPFIGELDGERVIPEQVQGQTTVTCPSCGGDMRPRKASSDGRARHFFHLNDHSCSGGESDEHRKMKSLAVSKLRQKFDGQYTTCGPEKPIPVVSTSSSVDRRFADALIQFEEYHPDYANGLIVEVQFKNEGKEIPITTKDYLAQGFSVYWAHPRDFTDTRLRFDRLESAFDNNSNLAHTPHDSVKVGEYEEFDLLWDDPVPDCDHVWKDMGEFDFCARCRINRTYSNTRARFLYDNMGFLGPLERDDVPEVPESSLAQRQTDSETASDQGEKSVKSKAYGPNHLPHGIPDECPHYNGPDHHWIDYGWADQGKAQCQNCGATVWKDELPDSVVIHNFM